METHKAWAPAGSSHDGYDSISNKRDYRMKRRKWEKDTVSPFCILSIYIPLPHMHAGRVCACVRVFISFVVGVPF